MEIVFYFFYESFNNVYGFYERMYRGIENGVGYVLNLSELSVF